MQPITYKKGAKMKATGANQMQKVQIKKMLKEGDSVSEVSDHFHIKEEIIETFVTELENSGVKPDVKPKKATSKRRKKVK